MSRTTRLWCQGPRPRSGAGCWGLVLLLLLLLLLRTRLCCACMLACIVPACEGMPCKHSQAAHRTLWPTAASARWRACWPPTTAAERGGSARVPPTDSAGTGQHARTPGAAADAAVEAWYSNEELQGLRGADAAPPPSDGGKVTPAGAANGGRSVRDVHVAEAAPGAGGVRYGTLPVAWTSSGPGVVAVTMESLLGHRCVDFGSSRGGNRQARVWTCQSNSGRLKTTWCVACGPSAVDGTCDGRRICVCERERGVGVCGGEGSCECARGMLDAIKFLGLACWSGHYSVLNVVVALGAACTGSRPQTRDWRGRVSETAAWASFTTRSGNVGVTCMIDCNACADPVPGPVGCHWLAVRCVRSQRHA